jgi:4-hydroxybenzoate polyprenyltransferase
MSVVTTRHPSGSLAPYLLHLRPAEWPVMAAHTLLGWFLAAGLRAPTGPAWLGIAAWVVLLNGGTLALNSSFDRDDGDIAFLHNPPAPPRHLALFAILLIAAGFAVSLQLPSTYRRLYLVCVVMSIAYSVPPVRLKAVAGMDWVINMIGFGTLTPYAAWAISGRPLDGPLAPVLWSFTPLFAALYPLTQLYQMDEDRARGDRTLALRLGARGSLTVAIFCATVAFGMLAMAGWRSGWYGYELKRWGALAIAAGAWVAVLAPWFRNARTWSTREHQRAMYHALAAWALTDVAVLLAWAA